MGCGAGPQTGARECGDGPGHRWCGKRGPAPGGPAVEVMVETIASLHPPVPIEEAAVHVLTGCGGIDPRAEVAERGLAASPGVERRHADDPLQRGRVGGTVPA